MTKRWKILIICFAVIIGLLTCRLGYIQLLGHEDLSMAARTQQQITLAGADTRGTIYDRNGTPVAGEHQEYIIILKEGNYDGETQNALNYLDAVEVPNEGSGYKVFTSGKYIKSIGERLIRNSDAYIIEAGRRYKENQPAVHMIGYVNTSDNSGASGLELMCSDELAAANRKVTAPADVYGNLLSGYGLMVTSEDENDLAVKTGIRTTLDLGIQTEAEKALSECKKDGAIVVLNCKTGEIAAAASTPVYDPARIDEYMDSKGGELINKVTQGEYPPGSVFKLVVAAAALESGISPTQIFECDGSVTVNGHTVRCSTGGNQGHGKISFTEALADSCNCAFISLGQKIGADAVLDMAERLGLGSEVLDGFPGEKSGNLMTKEQSEGAITNLSIGQGEILATPLQIAAMTAVIANDGKGSGVGILLDDQREEVRCISEETALQLQKMMQETATTGTGKGLGLDGLAGMKTGSAEGIQGGHQVVHGWVTGYIPADDPQYVITAFVEDGKSGRESAGPLFKAVAEYISDKRVIENEINL